MHLKHSPPKSLGPRAPRQAGFALVAAMFVMIIIAMVIAAMMRMAGNQHGTNSLAIQQARAYQSARAGLDWAIAQAVGAGSCVGSTPINMAGSSLAEFTVTVTCNASTYSDNGAALNIYRLTATAQNGVPGSRPDMAFRRLTAVVEK
jgi:MSHA biogenesis protein MshP